MRHLTIFGKFRKTEKASSVKSAQTCTKKEVNLQDKVNKSITLLILKHDNNIITLIDEVKS